VGTHHLELEHGLVAVIQQVLGLAIVNANNAEEQLTAQPERHHELLAFLSDDSV
jgi:hypothetical protein